MRTEDKNIDESSWLFISMIYFPKFILILKNKQLISWSKTASYKILNNLFNNNKVKLSPLSVRQSSINSTMSKINACRFFCRIIRHRLHPFISDEAARCRICVYLSLPSKGLPSLLEIAFVEASSSRFCSTLFSFSNVSLLSFNFLNFSSIAV